MSNIVEAKNLSFSYPLDENERTFALKELNIEIEKGSFTVILGKNGSGKSSFAKLINALNRPDEGTLTVAGMDTSNESDTIEIRKNAGMVFQNPDNQLVATIVEEDIAFGPENLGLPRDEIRERIGYALKVVNMSQYLKHAPHMLSGGQKQRIAIAGVRAMKPQLIIFDESTAMRDPKGRKDIMNIMHELNRNEGITIIHITHYMEEAVGADKVIVFRKGRILKEGTPEEIFFDKELLRESGLVPTFEARLINDLEDRGIDLDKTLDMERLAGEICR